MLKLLPLSTLVIVLSTLYRDASTAESEIFHIKSETVIQTSKFGNEEQYHFPSSLEYTVTSLQQRFSLRLSKSDKEIKPMRTRHGVHSSILLVEQETFSHRQVAIYTDVELKTIVALNCDSTYHTCHLTGSICNKEKRWMISPVEGEPNKYIAVRQYGATYDITDAMRDGQQWQINGENPTGERRPHQHVRYHFKEGRQRRDIDQHVLNRQRRADTNCNIFEVLAVPDATVFEFFLERNNQDRPAAFSDQFQHYSALFREDESQDWTIRAGTGNVDGIPSLAECASFMNSTEDGVFCFTRDQIQFVPPEDDFTGIVNTGVTCNNGSTKSAIFEDFHDGLSRLIAFAIALQIDGSIIHCTDNIFNVDDLDITYPDDEADFPLTYMFSDCAQDLLATTIDGFINDGNNCLMTGLITDDLFDELVNESLLAGEVIPLEHQCQLAYGPDSQSCEQIDAKTNMTIETTGICGPGVFCMVNGECVNRTIVYSGTPCDTHKICFKGTCSCDFKCGQPPTVPGGYYSLTSSDSISGEAMLTCFDGYTTNSPETITCRSNGWMNPRGGCSLRECDVPEVENGVYVPLIDNTFGNIAILQCNEGFASSSNITSIVCQANGTYSPHMAQCITDCGCPPETENGIYVLDSDSTLLNSTAKLFCCNGTYVRLNSRITCEVDGWMGIANCSENPCPTSDWIQEGFSCYLFDTTNRFFNQSRDFCLETSGANLVKIENMAENDFLDFYATNISRPEPETGFWIGLVQDGPNGTLRWQDGDEVTFEAFQDGQPDDRNFNGTISQQSCTMIWRPFNYSWADIECDVGVPGEPDMRMGFALCEFELDPHIIY